MSESDDPIARVLDLLSEARRFARSNPEAATRLAQQAAFAIERLDPVPVSLYRRLPANLREAGKYVWVSPDVFSGYVLGASIEIQAWVAKAKETQDQT